MTLEPWSVELSVVWLWCWRWMDATSGGRCKSERKTTTMSAKVSLCETLYGRYLGFYVSVYHRTPLYILLFLIGWCVFELPCIKSWLHIYDVCKCVTLLYIYIQKLCGCVLHKYIEMLKCCFLVWFISASTHYMCVMKSASTSSRMFYTPIFAKSGGGVNGLDS